MTSDSHFDSTPPKWPALNARLSCVIRKCVRAPCGAVAVIDEMMSGIEPVGGVARRPRAMTSTLRPRAVD